MLIVGGDATLLRQEVGGKGGRFGKVIDTRENKGRGGCENEGGESR